MAHNVYILKKKNDRKMFNVGNKIRHGRHKKKTTRRHDDEEGQNTRIDLFMFLKKKVISLFG